MRVIIDSAIPFLRGVFEPYADVRYIAGSAISHRDCMSADALVVRTRTRCDAALLDRTPVTLIATATIGFDHIDLEYCRRRGIEVCTAAGCNARGVLQWVAAVLALAVEHPEHHTLGIVGVGHVGQAVKEYAEAWGFRVLGCDPPRAAAEKRTDFVDMAAIARECDIVTFHTPLDATTYHLADKAFFDAAARRPLIINSSRGAVADNSALLASGLRCALDVWEGEPDIDRALLDCAFIASPHIAGYTLQGKANASAAAVAAVARRFSLPLHDWFPDPTVRVKSRAIGWNDMRRLMPRYFDVQALTRTFKAHPAQFESLRNGYELRREFF